jgi:hypothetical protein
LHRQAALFESKGQYLEAAGQLETILEKGLENPQAEAAIRVKIQRLLTLDWLQKAREKMNVAKPSDLAGLHEAMEFFESAERSARDPKAQGELSVLAEEAQKNRIFLQVAQVIECEGREGHRAEAIQKLKKAMETYPDHPFLRVWAEALKFDPAAFGKHIGQAVQALKEPWRTEALTEALRALALAREADPAPPRLKTLEAYAADMKACQDLGMVLVNRFDPATPDAAWSAAERKEAFCVDRYEFPNQVQQRPKAGMTWLEAKVACEMLGKTLCSSKQWRTACMAKEYVRNWPFGQELILKACHWEGTEVKPSGAFPACHNTIGAFDMSGNLAEWTSDGPEPGQAFLYGGHFETGPWGARCSSQTASPMTQTTPVSGFRCCKTLNPDQAHDR